MHFARFVIAQYGVQYLWSLKFIPDFTPEINAYMRMAQQALGILANFAIVPLLSLKLHWHESAILMLVNSLNFTAMTLMAFSNKIWQLFATNSLSAFQIMIYGSGRSMLSKCVAPEEVVHFHSLVYFTQ